MTLTAFTEGPQREGELPAEDSVEQQELNTMNSCKASLQVARMRLHTEMGHKSLRGEESQRKNYSKHASFTLSSFKR